ncbi:hypothetical protein ACN38_g2614 [Penicillium nordicum]|uniref:Uncharacterized protein n=1 Tax=Penicillium nordicum TaxID=229535 RepID=A0A0M8P6H8_9EURO|nr:hypothetical protein ACN38_g2614 [Penicillium nordicum]
MHSSPIPTAKAISPVSLKNFVDRLINGTECRKLTDDSFADGKYSLKFLLVLPLLNSTLECYLGNFQRIIFITKLGVARGQVWKFGDY